MAYPNESYTSNVPAGTYVSDPAGERFSDSTGDRVKDVAESAGLVCGLNGAFNELGGLPFT